MIYDMIGNQVHSAPQQLEVKHIEGNNVTEFYTSGYSDDVIAVLRALPTDKFSCINEAVASIRRGSHHTYKVSMELKKSFFTRRIYEHAYVYDHLENRVFESHRRVEPNPKPFNIASVIG
jgi:hypothetical protein